jgi:flagellar basal body rod protein FlgC
MTNMISANRAFATNVEAINTARDLLAQNDLDGPLRLGDLDH